MLPNVNIIFIQIDTISQAFTVWLFGVLENLKVAPLEILFAEVPLWLSSWLIFVPWEKTIEAQAAGAD